MTHSGLKRERDFFESQTGAALLFGVCNSEGSRNPPPRKGNYGCEGQGVGG